MYVGKICDIAFTTHLLLCRNCCFVIWRHLLTVNRTRNIGEQVVSNYTTRWQVVPPTFNTCVHVDGWEADLGPHLWTRLCNYVILYWNGQLGWTPALGLYWYWNGQLVWTPALGLYL